MEANTRVTVFLDQSDVQEALKAFVAEKYPVLCMNARGIDFSCSQPWNFTISVDEKRELS